MISQMAAADPPGDYRAEILHNLCKFVTWPESAFQEGEGMNIRLLHGDEPISDLMALNGRKLHGKTITIRGQVRGEGVEKGEVIFISRGFASSVSKILKRLGNRPVLTISDIPGFSRQGGMIELISAGETVRFSINLGAARRAGLIIRAPLLQIAQVFEGLPPPNEEKRSP